MKFFYILSLLTTWYNYSSIYVYKEKTEGDESKQEKFCKSGFLDVMM